MAHNEKGVEGRGGAEEFSIRANIIFNCGESARGRYSRLQSPDLPGIGNQLQEELKSSFQKLFITELWLLVKKSGYASTFIQSSPPLPPSSRLEREQ